MANLVQRATRNLISYALFGPKNIQYRSTLENPSTPLSFPAEWLLDIFNGGSTDSGIRVSEMTALQVSTVLACINIVSSGVASLPLNVMEVEYVKGREKKTRAHDHSLYELLRKTPNCEMTAHTFFKTLQAHAMLWGNAYAEITYDNRGQIHSIFPRNPARIRPARITRPMMIDGDKYPTGTLVFKTDESIVGSEPHPNDWQPNYATERIILAENVIHVPGLSLDGRLGQSTVWLARQIFGLALATEKYSAKFFGNGAVPRGILELPNAMEEKAIEELRRQWAEAHGGENSHKVAVLTAGMKFTPIGEKPDESQLLESRKFQREEIAALFNVPGHMVGVTGAGAKSNVEQTSIEFLNYTLKPWLNAWEQELERKLFPDFGRTAGQFIPQFDTRTLLYPDASSRTGLYSGGKQWGYLSTNDIHELENMNPVEDASGDEYWMPVNMQKMDDPVTLGQEAQHEFDKAHPPAATPEPNLSLGGKPGAGGGAQAGGGGGAKGGGAAVPAKPQPKRSAVGLLTSYSNAYSALFRDAIGRVAARKDTKEADIRRIFQPIICTVVDVLDEAVNQDKGKRNAGYSQEIAQHLVEMFKRCSEWTPETKSALAEAESRYAFAKFYTILNG